jgi:hypothetical protein
MKIQREFLENPIFKEEFLNIARLHSDELDIETSLDILRLESLEKMGLVVINTFRVDDKLVGYIGGIISPNLLHSGEICLHIQGIFILRKYRTYWNVKKLIESVREFCSKYTIQRIYFNTVSYNKTLPRILEMLGFAKTSITYVGYGHG